MADIFGTEGNDTLEGGAGNDVLDGRGGWNVVAYWGAGSAVGVQLGRGLTSNDGYGATDILLNIHGVFGSAFDDVILGGDLSDLLAGLGGSDTLEGWGGDDAITGYSGDDRISGGAGSDTAYYGGRRADYTITAFDGGFAITHNGTFVEWGATVNEGTDTVTEVERFRFADGFLSAANLLTGTPTPEEPPPAVPTITGTAGDDRLVPSNGADIIDGLGGRDWVDFRTAGHRGAAVQAQPDGSVVLTHGGHAHTLRGVEEVRFADGRLVFDAADPAAQVARLYEAALDRLPDQGGLNFWIGAVQGGQSLSALAQGFIASPEFQARFGGASASNGAFVDQLYLNVLGRPAEAGGRDFWAGSLDRGAASRAEVLVGISESAENKAGTAALVQRGIWDRSEEAAEVARMYDTVFGRKPDVGGLSFWKGALEGGAATLAQMADAFAGSAEFKSQYGALDNRGFADALYVNTLDRPADRAGLDHWTGVLNSGVSRAEVVLAFSESAEHVALTATSIGGEVPAQYGILFA